MTQSSQSDCSLIEWLTAELWTNGFTSEDPQVYALLDGARDPRIEPMLRGSSANFTCLYAGELSPSLSAAAPYLVHLTRQQPFTHELLQNSWGQSWGYFLVAAARVSLQDLRSHLRTLLKVIDHEGNTLVFRFYDPRVLRTYLPSCTPLERAALFGPITMFIAETSTAHSLITFPRHPADTATARLRIWPSADNYS